MIDSTMPDVSGAPEPEWTAKNVRPDWLRMTAKVCDNDVRFVKGNEALLITATRYGEVRTRECCHF